MNPNAGAKTYTAFAAFAALSLSPAFASAASLTLTVTDIPKAGTLNIGIFDTAEGFEAKDRGGAKRRPGLVEGIRHAVEASAARLTIELPEGRYAIKLFLDLNGNGEVDTNFLGIPKEPYGFSNNAKGTLGPPSFDAAAFTIEGPRDLSIAL
jgi:uncharacterized protein (DUF2141 family)